MPLELACEDANYAVTALDMYGQPEDPNMAMSNVIPVAKHKLRPENPAVTATGVGTEVRISWDALPACGQDPTHLLTGYSEANLDRRRPRQSSHGDTG